VFKFNQQRLFDHDIVLFAFFTFLNRGSKCQWNFILIIFFLAKLFLLMRSCIFKSSSLCFYYAFTHHFPLLKNPKSRSSITKLALHTENEWPNFKEYILVEEEEE